VAALHVAYLSGIGLGLRSRSLEKLNALMGLSESARWT
jgi:hypothetical protein